MRADAMTMEIFGAWDFDLHPFAALGGYDEARRVFGGAESLARLIAGFNAAVFGRPPPVDGTQGAGREEPLTACR